MVECILLCLFLLISSSLIAKDATDADKTASASGGVGNFQITVSIDACELTKCNHLKGAAVSIVLIKSCCFLGKACLLASRSLG